MSKRRWCRPWGMGLLASAVIAATALAHGLPLVSRNARHFARVTNLQVVAY